MYRKFVTVIFGVYGIHCGMLFRVIHVQSLIRGYFTRRVRVDESESACEKERKSAREWRQLQNI